MKWPKWWFLSSAINRKASFFTLMMSLVGAYWIVYYIHHNREEPVELEKADILCPATSKAHDFSRWGEPHISRTTGFSVQYRACKDCGYAERRQVE